MNVSFPAEGGSGDTCHEPNFHRQNKPGPGGLHIANQEAEIGRIMIWSQTQANIFQDPILKKPNTKQG
jgi:hypothetical protein